MAGALRANQKVKAFLTFLFTAVLLTMLWVTIRAGSQINLWDAWDDYAANPWAVATLYDAYFGFLAFYCWVVWRERRTWARVLWFVLIACLGNIAMSVFVLVELRRLRPDEPAGALFSRRP
jgi:hypothetical protein